MANVYISEYARLGRDSLNNATSSPEEPATVVDVIANPTTSQQSAAFNKTTTIVEIHADAAIHFEFGADPTAATATSRRMAADVTRFFAVKAGSDLKVAVINAA